MPRSSDVQEFGHGAGTGAAPGARRIVAAAAAGNLLEWYEWGVYGYVVSYIGIHFFPSSSGSASLLAAFAAFGAGFLMRPVGAVLIGIVGERRGRKDALLLTLLIMAAGTVPIAFIPGHEQIGIWAPVLLLVCRLMQGFSTGGELGGSLAFLAEWAPGQARGLTTSLQQASTQGGMLLGSAVVAFLHAVLEPGQMARWGWRLPFLIGGLLFPLAFWLRRHIGETPLFLAQRRQAAPAPPLPAMVPRVGVAIALIAGPVACQYMFFTYLTTFAVDHGGLAPEQALLSNAVALAVLIVATPLMGALSDRVGRRPLLAGASLVLLLAAAPLFRFVASGPGLAGVLGAQAGLAVIVGMYHGAGPAAVIELFPTQGRALLVSVAYAVGVALAGGFAPYCAIRLIEATGSAAAPALYLAGACILTGCTALRMRETAHLRLA